MCEAGDGDCAACCALLNTFGRIIFAYSMYVPCPWPDHE